MLHIGSAMLHLLAVVTVAVCTWKRFVESQRSSMMQPCSALAGWFQRRWLPVLIGRVVCVHGCLAASLSTLWRVGTPAIIRVDFV